MSTKESLDVMTVWCKVDVPYLSYFYHYLGKEEKLASYPRDWWQAVKQRWFPFWILRRWPVEYTQIIAIHKFPEAEIPSLGKEFVHLEYKEKK